MDQIADLIIRIKNASAIGQLEISMPFSKIKEAILGILKDEGFVEEFSSFERENKKFIKVSISDKKTLSHFRQISKPGHRIYTKSKTIRLPLRGFGTAIISTSSGVINAKEARSKGIGGELICEIW